MHHILVYREIFMYPGDQKSPQGKGILLCPPAVHPVREQEELSPVIPAVWLLRCCSLACLCGGQGKRNQLYFPWVSLQAVVGLKEKAEIKSCDWWFLLSFPFGLTLIVHHEPAVCLICHRLRLTFSFSASWFGVIDRIRNLMKFINTLARKMHISIHITYTTCLEGLQMPWNLPKNPLEESHTPE